MLNLTNVDISLPTSAEIPNTISAQRVGRAYEGTIGNDLFADTVLEIDYARQTVRLYDPATYQYKGGGKSFPLTIHDGMPAVRAKFDVSGHKSGEGGFVINTALDAPLLISDRFAQAAPSFFVAHEDHFSSLPANWTEAGNAVMARIKDFQIGPYEVAGAAGRVCGREIAGRRRSPGRGRNRRGNAPAVHRDSITSGKSPISRATGRFDPTTTRT